jgi:hypothetical protein
MKVHKPTRMRVHTSMSPKSDQLQENEQDEQKAAQEMAVMLETYLSPFLLVLDALLDKRDVAHTCTDLRCYSKIQE